MRVRPRLRFGLVSRSATSKLARRARRDIPFFMPDAPETVRCKYESRFSASSGALGTDPEARPNLSHGRAGKKLRIAEVVGRVSAQSCAPPSRAAVGAGDGAGDGMDAMVVSGGLFRSMIPENSGPGFELSLRTVRSRSARHCRPFDIPSAVGHDNAICGENRAKNRRRTANSC